MRTPLILALTAPLFIIGCGEKDVADDSAEPANSPPSISSVTVTPSEAYEDSVLECSAEGWADADGDAEGLLFNWLVNGAPSGDTPSLVGTDFNKGDEVICEVTPDDGTDLGEPVLSAPVRVLNTPPLATGASLDLEEASVLDTLNVSATETQDLDGDTVTMSWTWFVNDAEVASGERLDLADYARDDSVYAVGVPNDGEVDGAPVQTDTLTIGNAPAQVTEILFEPGAITTDSVLSFSVTVEDADGDPTSWGHAWYINGQPSSVGNLTLDGSLHFDKGDTVLVQIVADDGNEESAPVDSEVLTVQNTTPGEPGVVITPTSPAAGQQDVTCAVETESVDADGDAVSYSFSWTVDGSAYSDATDDLLSSVVDASATSEGEEWSCTVTPNDGEGDGATAEILATIRAALPDLDVDGVTETLTEGSYEYYDVNVINGAVLEVEGEVTLVAIHSFTVDADSWVYGDGLGNAGGDNTPSVGDGDGGGGVSTNSGSGGGGYGGDGGTGGYDSSDTPGAGGAAYGSETDPSIQQGSGGGGSQDGDGGDAGAGLAVYSPTIDVAGLLTCSGHPGVNSGELGYGRGGGGGSGGGIMLVGQDITITGEVYVDGGDGGVGDATYTDDGGGGGGGRIKIFYETSLDTSSAYLSSLGGAGGPNGGAAGGVDGSPGTIYEAQATYEAP